MSCFFFLLLLPFVIIVAPIWIISHYLTKWRTSRGLSAEDERMLAELWESAGKMESRIHSLERILDAEAPGWRTRL
jgi:phage shock protein B